MGSLSPGENGGRLSARTGFLDGIDGVHYVRLGTGAMLASAARAAESASVPEVAKGALVQTVGEGENRLMNRVNILGVGVSTVNMEVAVARIQSWIEQRKANYVIAGFRPTVLSSACDTRGFVGSTTRREW